MSSGDLTRHQSSCNACSHHGSPDAHALYWTHDGFKRFSFAYKYLNYVVCRRRAIGLDGDYPVPIKFEKGRGSGCPGRHSSLWERRLFRSCARATWRPGRRRVRHAAGRARSTGALDAWPRRRPDAERTGFAHSTDSQIEHECGEHSPAPREPPGKTKEQSAFGVVR